MDNEQTYIFGYLEVYETALCVPCATDAYFIQTALGSGIIEAIRSHHAEMISETLRCVKCAEAILAPKELQPEKLEAFREFVERIDLGKEL